MVRNRLPQTVTSLRLYIDLLTKIAMVTILTINGAALRPYIASLDFGVVRLFAIVAIHSLTNFTAALGISALLLRKSHPSIPPVMYAASMKNNAAGVVIATNYFDPVIALPVVVSMIIKHLLAGVFCRIIDRCCRRGLSEGHSETI